MDHWTCWLLSNPRDIQKVLINLQPTVLYLHQMVRSEKSRATLMLLSWWRNRACLFFAKLRALLTPLLKSHNDGQERKQLWATLFWANSFKKMMPSCLLLTLIFLYNLHVCSDQFYYYILPIFSKECLPFWDISVSRSAVCLQ